ncbi:MAG: hypothetical protein E6Q49_01930 [Limnohabitans sp.]|nr:MAG: hypothetical protein E6Q49_01930 [Limnohabitans sp.]
MLNTEDCVVGEDAQPGVDALGVIINGSFVRDLDEVETYIEMNGYLDVDFVFVQAKTSASFDVSALGNLGDTVERLFESGPIAVDNEKVHSFCALKDAIFSKSRAFKRRNPAVHLYYVSSGSTPYEDANFSAKERLIVNRLLKPGTLSSAHVTLIGAQQIQRRSLQISNSLSREILFPKRVTMPDVPGVTQAFLGILPLVEFLKLIQGEADTLLTSIFYDNVRDWEGFNTVNSGMQATLEDQSSRSRFSLMNNGVTVIARKLQPTGDKIVLEDYQLVNGCQTSNVIWACRNRLQSGDVAVPIKIVATEDEGVIRDIIRATNSQTEIKPSQLLAITDFQKQLELFFRAQGENSLFYERRSRQYVNQRIEPRRVVTPIGLVKAFSSMFLEEPHKTARDFGSVLKKVGGDIFGSEHKPDVYFLCAVAYFWIETFLKRFDPALRVARYQVLLAVRLIHEDAAPPSISSRKAERYVSAMLAKFSDADAAENALKPAFDVVSKLMAGKSRDLPRTSGFTQSLKDAIEELKRSGNAKPQRTARKRSSKV